MSGTSSKRYPVGLRERAVRLLAEIRDQHESEWAAMGRVAGPLGIGRPETVRKWCRQAEVDAGAWSGVTSGESAEMKRLRRENAELKRADDLAVGVSVTMTLENVDSQQARELQERTSKTARVTLSELASELVEGSRGLWVLEAASELVPDLDAESPRGW